MNLEIEVKKIKEEIKNGNLHDALELAYESLALTDFGVDFTIYLHRFNRNKRNFNLGLLTEHEFDKVCNSIVLGAIQNLDKLSSIDKSKKIIYKYRKVIHEATQREKLLLLIKPHFKELEDGLLFTFKTFLFTELFVLILSDIKNGKINEFKNEEYTNHYIFSNFQKWLRTTKGMDSAYSFTKEINMVLSEWIRIYAVKIREDLAFEETVPLFKFSFDRFIVNEITFNEIEISQLVLDNWIPSMSEFVEKIKKYPVFFDFAIKMQTNFLSQYSQFYSQFYKSEFGKIVLNNYDKDNLILTIQQQLEIEIKKLAGIYEPNI